MRYCKKLIGRKCYLSTINTEDYPIYWAWLNDMEVSINLRSYFQHISLHDEREFLQHIARHTPEQYVFAIVTQENDELIGNCSLVNVDMINRRAELGIFIGNKNYWGKGCGSEAIYLLLDYAFNVLNLHNVWLHYLSFNEKAGRLYERCGFKHIGRRREAIERLGKKYDVVMMDILAGEYRSIYLENLIK